MSRGKTSVKSTSPEQTRSNLVRHARRLFAKGGQRAVGVIEVSRAAKVTTGALYHHFKNREALLRAVLEDVAQSVADRAAEAMQPHTDPWARLEAGINAVLDLCLEPDVKLAYNEAAAILGLEAWRQLEEAKTGALLMKSLFEVAATGSLKPVSLELLAAMVKGALVEAAMSITRSKAPKRLRAEAGTLLQALLAGLRV
jgi:AcrR family transcriptional regulator